MKAKRPVIDYYTVRLGVILRSELLWGKIDYEDENGFSSVMKTIDMSRLLTNMYTKADHTLIII